MSLRVRVCVRLCERNLGIGTKIQIKTGGWRESSISLYPPLYFYHLDPLYPVHPPLYPFHPLYGSSLSLASHRIHARLNQRSDKLATGCRD